MGCFGLRCVAVVAAGLPAIVRAGDFCHLGGSAVSALRLLPPGQSDAVLYVVRVFAVCALSRAARPAMGSIVVGQKGAVRLGTYWAMDT